MNLEKKKLKFTSKKKKCQLGGQGFLKGYKMSIFAAFAAFAALRGPKIFKALRKPKLLKLREKLSEVGMKPPSHSEKSKTIE